MISQEQLLIEALCVENERKDKIINENKVLINALLEQLEGLQN